VSPTTSLLAAVRAAVLVAVPVLLAGCFSSPDPVPSAPPAIRPTLEGVHAMGFTCGDGVEDNVPSGLFQWICTGIVEENPSTVLVNGNAAGLTEVVLVIDESIDPRTLVAGFERLVTTVPPLSRLPALPSALAGWTRAEERIEVAGVAVLAECDVQCQVFLGSAAGPLAPLPTD
jgi:hypothetical protein